jgi:NADH:ubiquinone oxidoreductase subunit D
MPHYRARQPACFAPDQQQEGLDFMCRGHQQADVPALIGMMDVVFGEMDL